MATEIIASPAAESPTRPGGRTAAAPQTPDRTTTPARPDLEVSPLPNPALCLRPSPPHGHNGSPCRGTSHEYCRFALVCLVEPHKKREGIAPNTNGVRNRAFLLADPNPPSWDFRGCPAASSWEPASGRFPALGTPLLPPSSTQKNPTNGSPKVLRDGRHIKI